MSEFRFLNEATVVSILRFAFVAVIVHIMVSFAIERVSGSSHRRRPAFVVASLLLPLRLVASFCRLVTCSLPATWSFRPVARRGVVLTSWLSSLWLLCPSRWLHGAAHFGPGRLFDAQARLWRALDISSLGVTSVCLLALLVIRYCLHTAAAGSFVRSRKLLASLFSAACVRWTPSRAK